MAACIVAFSQPLVCNTRLLSHPEAAREKAVGLSNLLLNCQTPYIYVCIGCGCYALEPFSFSKNTQSHSPSLGTWLLGLDVLGYCRQLYMTFPSPSGVWLVSVSGSYYLSLLMFDLPVLRVAGVLAKGATCCGW